MDITIMIMDAKITATVATIVTTMAAKISVMLSVATTTIIMEAVDVDAVADAEVVVVEDAGVDVGATNTSVNQAVGAAATVDLDFTPLFTIMMISTTMEDVEVGVEVEAVATKADMPAVAATAPALLVAAVLAPATNHVDPADATHADADE